jgi:hypothetical protein
LRARPWKARADIILSSSIRVSDCGHAECAGTRKASCHVALIRAVEPMLGETVPFAGSYMFGAQADSISSAEQSCEMPSMKDDVPARDAAEGRASLYAVSPVALCTTGVALRTSGHLIKHAPVPLHQQSPSATAAAMPTTAVAAPLQASVRGRAALRRDEARLRGRAFTA